MLKKEMKRYAPYILIGIIVFISMFIYYYIAHPLYIYDVDDWVYVTGVRHALPSVRQWNPTRILPETMMPLISSLGAWIIYPVSGDYIQSLCMAYAVFTALLIAVYFVMCARLLKQRNETKAGSLMVLMIISLMLHFYLYLKEETWNQHFFWAGNVTCVFYYLLSALWNFILCLYFMTSEKLDWKDKRNPVKKGLIILAVYLAINSNLWHSIILMSYFGIELLFCLIGGALRQKRSLQKISVLKFLKNYIVEHFPKLVALAMWFVSMLFEINGGRAQWNTEESLQLKEAVKAFLYSVTEIRKDVLVALILINVVGLIIAAVQMKKAAITGQENAAARDFLVGQAKGLSAMCLTIIFLILLASKVSPEYLKNSSVMISWMIWLLMVTMLSATYMLKLEPRIGLIMPLIAYILIFETFIDKKSFAENYASNLPSSVVKALDDDIIRQVKTAEENGEDSVTVYIPVKGSGGWPINPGMIQTRISNALYYHGVTEKHMTIAVVPDESKDEEFHIK